LECFLRKFNFLKATGCLDTLKLGVKLISTNGLLSLLGAK
jgi:hypothetical protein